MIAPAGGGGVNRDVVLNLGIDGAPAYANVAMQAAADAAASIFAASHFGWPNSFLVFFES